MKFRTCPSVNDSSRENCCVLLGYSHHIVANARQFGAGQHQRWIAALCLVVILVFTGVEALHVDQDSNTPCLICISAHANAPAVIVHVQPVLSAVEILPVLYEINTKSIASQMRLFSRPPPSV